MNSRYSVVEEQCLSRPGAEPFTEYQIFDNETGCFCGVMYDKGLAETAVGAMNAEANGKRIDGTIET